MFINRFEHALNQGSENMVWFAIQTVLERCPKSSISIHWGMTDIVERFLGSLTFYEEEAVTKLFSEWLPKNGGNFVYNFQALKEVLSRFEKNQFQPGDLLSANVYHIDTGKTEIHYALVESVSRGTIIASDPKEPGEVFTISPFTGFRPVPKTLGFWYQISIPVKKPPKREPRLQGLLERLRAITVS